MNSTDPQFEKTKEAFGLAGQASRLVGGTTANYRVGDVVLKRIRETSLENNRSPELASWISQFSSELAQDGFRIPPAVKTTDGGWITPEGWTASQFLPGRHAQSADIPACIAGIQALHRSLVGIPEHPAMHENRTAWGYAQRGCLGEVPDGLQPELSGLVEKMKALRKPIPLAPYQLMHGDLNPENILIQPGLPPAFLDFSPFWGPPELALAIFANFIGPRRGDGEAIAYFTSIPHFPQLLLRAGLRMLLVVAALNGLDGWQQSSEKWAAEWIIAYVEASL